MSKIRQYFSTFELTRGFLIALLSSGFIYLDYWDFSHPLFSTILGILALYFLLQEERKVWFFSGFFIGILWFYWVGLSFIHYDMNWAVPFAILIMGMIYGIIFWIIAYLAEKLSLFFGSKKFTPIKNSAAKASSSFPKAINLLIKALALIFISYVHPFGFDWFKPELMFLQSYIGILKWQFALVLFSISLALWKKQLLYLFIIIFAYQPIQNNSIQISKGIEIVSTHTTVKDKWNETLHYAQFDSIFKIIDQAIDANKTLIILPESVFPVFINRSQELIDALQEKAKYISIIAGGLYWDGSTPRNSTYIFTDNKVTVANKVVLVPFGESNPLPDFLSDWVNKVFYDGAVDYKASKNIIDYQIKGETYRNAICFEATSERLYEGKPQNMIVLSNNGWFTPSIEPTLQKLLLQYYSKKYGTTIYHSANMSNSYIIQNGIHLKD